MTGYRSSYFRHSCPTNGCYVQQLPSWDDIISEAFPRRIRPTDIDGLVEINGHILLMEEKSEGKGPDEGQRQALKTLSEKPDITVIYFRPKGDDLMEVLVLPDPIGWQTVTREWLKQWIRSWVSSAEAAPRSRTVIRGLAS